MSVWQTIVPAGVVKPGGQWQIYEKLRPIAKTRGYVTIPAFSLEPENVSWKRLVCQYNYRTDSAFSFSEYPQIRPSNDWMIVLSWRRGRIKARFQLWPDDNYGFLIYNQHIIHRYFTIEFWCKNCAAISLLADLTFKTSHQFEDTHFTGWDVNFGVASSLVAQDLLLDPSPIPVPLPINDNQTWLDNTGTWNETTAGSEKDASIIFPSSNA